MAFHYEELFDTLQLPGQLNQGIIAWQSIIKEIENPNRNSEWKYTELLETFGDKIFIEILLDNGFEYKYNSHDILIFDESKLNELQLTYEEVHGLNQTIKSTDKDAEDPNNMPLHDGVRLRGRLAVRIRSNDDQKKVLQTANATETSIGSIASDKETAECDVKDAYASRMALPPPVLAAFNTHKTVGLPSPSTTHTKPQFGMSNKFGIGHNNSKHAHSIDSDTQSNEDEIDIDSFVDDVKDALCRDVVAEFNFQNKHIIPSLTFGTNHVDIDIKDEDIANDDTFTFQGRVTNHQHSLISIDEYETMPRGNEGDCNDQALERLCSDGIRQLDASLDVRCFIEWKRKNNIGVSGFSRDCTQKKKFARKVKKELQWTMPQAQRLYDFVSKRICWGDDRKTTDNADTFVMNPKAPTFVLSNDDKVAIVTSHPHNDATIPTILSNHTIMSNPNTISVEDPDSNSHSRSRSPFPTQSQCEHKTEKEEPSNGAVQHVIHCEPFKPSKRKQPGLRTNVFVSKEATRDLAEHIEDEDWGTNNGKLYKYLDYIFRCQIFDEQVKKITFSNKEEIVLFHTGLQRRRDLEFVYFALKPNDAHKRATQQWRVPVGPMDEVCFSKDELMGSPFNLQRKHVPQRTMFDELFDESYPIEVNLVEQLRIHKDRIYKELKQKTGLKEPFDCALKEAKKRVKANPRLVVAQGFVDSKHYKKRVEFLLPLKVKYSKESNQFHTFALALRKEENVKKYTGVSLLTTRMAYANARLVGYVNSSWLTSDNGDTHNRKNEMDEKKQDKDRSPSYHHPDTVNITGDNLPDTSTKPPDLPHTSNDPIVCKIHKVENRNGQMNDTQRPMGVKKPWSGKELFVFGGPSSSAPEIAKRNDAVLFHAGCDRTTAITAFQNAVQKLDKGSTILVHGYSNIKMYEPFVNCAVRNGCAKVHMMGRMRYPPWMDTSSNIWKCDSKVEVIYESV
eukprot:634940_1